MFCKVLAHQTPFILDRFTLLLWSTFLLLGQSFVQPTFAQILINGQVYTKGLAIVDAPAPNSNFQANNNLPIAIDVSGDGRLSQSAQVPGSTLSTRFEELQIFLVSYGNNYNATVSTGPGLLTQESGSTVKHLTFTIPQCTPSGQYELTFYENSVINDQAYYSITPIPIVVTGSSSEQCTSLNELLPVPQPSSPPSQNPWIACSSTQCTTVTGYSSSMPTSSGTGGGGFTTSYSPSAVTVTVEEHPSTTTVYLTSTATLTETVSGTIVMSTIVYTSTTMIVIEPSSSGNYVGYIPVNIADSLLFPRAYLAVAAIIFFSAFWTLNNCL
ncbi:hypothetical protein BJ138DRAFT_1122741 [Hygrophoropsis aurantiaca]|uniref:Uncharacterized protein n=1 Tax=Hygrophoropsis aurantiaca TaxID=72124 RepID=A0ACB8AQA9_9AGAM|nr:hypothetical protein BJ138DRAFT_1122741 [Hygrophoropsis aurantiaca]